jgi:hypothetical protein
MEEELALPHFHGKKKYVYSFHESGARPFGSSRRFTRGQAMPVASSEPVHNEQEAATARPSLQERDVLLRGPKDEP